MSKIIKFGEDVEGYSIPVLNEREIRATAGILFLVMLFSIQAAAGSGNFTPLKYAVTLFLTDMLIRVFISPKYSPTLILGRWIVRNQTPEYVGAQQKKFAWYIGIAMALVMFVLIVLVNSYSPITGLICFICLIFLFFESAFGICLGCKVYPWIYKDKAQYCPGEVCELKDRQEIQKTSKVQWLILFGFVVYAILLVVVFNDFYSRPPFDLFGLEGAMH
ncbi:MAG: DUF4395 domain-containing protein [Candidatus Marinimicrobia bacterium]|jgi:hypothetical protein|nr:DUF4395 domain-containing protein [Candidatus Neomarinimicrobiota bacterium]MBT3575520.1 DUF4395 domain-containing protein [Candidatus Neomarinimicrobiota bacterium]MBT3679617.1 DUF4395 domain-containing protein [Candidatus Neomarinimicrobiota bacterium]MBT3950574.1 DUF4395 domain-containing protein [Candidatus Neomarinimicrobiota bacterium]MBT4253439.1 DUF4395 domain-containing protein [Candidatus Neomarinimicrobiota bacterium]